MGDEDSVRIRRLSDGRKWFGRSARYEIEFRDVEDAVERVVTMSPGAELRRLTGIRHPADLATFTNAADLAWDGGTGPWRGWPGVDVEQDPAPHRDPPDSA